VQPPRDITISSAQLGSQNGPKRLRGKMQEMFAYKSESLTENASLVLVEKK